MSPFSMTDLLSKTLGKDTAPAPFDPFPTLTTDPSEQRAHTERRQRANHGKAKRTYLRRLEAAERANRQRLIALAAFKKREGIE